MRFAVVGGGIAGLSAAWELAGAAGDRTDVTLYEPGHLGGKLRTTEFLGRPVDEGPDSLLTRVPEGLALCTELGLGAELQGTMANRALLFSDGKLRPLPGGLVLGAPARLLPLSRSRILSVGGIGRASLDRVLPRRRLEGDDVSVWDLVASRLGPEVAERLVEPLLGSIHAGSTRQLSAAATAPQLLAATQGNRSLMAGLRRSAPAPQPSASGSPLFVAPRRGMQALADGLVQRLNAIGTTFVGVEVAGLRREQRSVVVEPHGERFDGVVLALPAPVAFSLLEQVLGEGSLPPLAAMEFASVAVATLAFAAPAFDDMGRKSGLSAALRLPDQQPNGLKGVSGVLVAPGSGLLMTACSFGSNKWPHWAAPGTTIVRLSAGRAAEQSWADLDDAALVDKLCEDLEAVMAPRSGAGSGVRGRRGAGGRGGTLPAPVAWRVSRWPGSMPQYEVGHLDRVASARATLARQAPMVSLAGASYSGVGVPACIGSGRRAARELLAAVEALGSPTS
jgi:protoporphyrinogen/coproporphyrinogen III oxidase